MSMLIIVYDFSAMVISTHFPLCFRLFFAYYNIMLNLASENATKLGLLPLVFPVEISRIYS